jgi:hypothetical protein
MGSDRVVRPLFPLGEIAMQIFAVEFTCAFDADIQKKLREARDEHCIPTDQIISVVLRNTIRKGVTKPIQEWVIVYRKNS